MANYEQMTDEQLIGKLRGGDSHITVSYTHLRAHET